MTIYKAPTKKNAPFKHVTDFTNLTTEELFASKDFTNAVDVVTANKLDKYDGPTYNINALVSLTAAEYAAITPDPNTIYFVI